MSKFCGIWTEIKQMRYYQHVFHLNLTLPRFSNLKYIMLYTLKVGLSQLYICYPITLELEAQDQEFKFSHTYIPSLRLVWARDLVSIYIYTFCFWIHTILYMTEAVQQHHRMELSLQDFSQQILTQVIMKVLAKSSVLFQ